MRDAAIQGVYGAEPIPTTTPVDTTEISWGGTGDTYSGTVPTELGLLTKVTSLAMSNLGPVTGPVPSELGNLVKVDAMFNLAQNTLRGALPTELGKLVKMTNNFYLGENSFTGEIPTELGELKKITNAFYRKLDAATPTKRYDTRQPCYH